MADTVEKVRALLAETMPCPHEVEDWGPGDVAVHHLEPCRDHAVCDPLIHRAYVMADPDGMELCFECWNSWTGSCAQHPRASR